MAGRSGRLASFEFVDHTFSSSGGQGRALDQHELRAGFFGEWHVRNKHGSKIVEWKKEENGYRLEMVVIDGELVLPRVSAVCAFALQVLRVIGAPALQPRYEGGRVPPLN